MFLYLDKHEGTCVVKGDARGTIFLVFFFSHSSFIMFVKCCCRCMLFALCNIVSLYLFSRRQNFGRNQTESICRQQISCCFKKLPLSLIGQKTLLENEKMLVTSILSFSYNVFSSPMCF